MDKDYIEAHDVIDRYVLGHLSEEELVGFELYYLEHPEVLEEIELTRALRGGLAANGAALAAATSRPAAGDQQGHGLLDAIADWFRNPAVLAGNFAVIAGLAVMVLQQGDNPAALGFSADRVWIGDVRGERAPLEIEVRSASLVLDIDVAVPGNYSVTLMDDAGQPLTRIPSVEASSDAILVVFDASRIDAGRYRINVDDPDNKTVLDRELLISIAE